MRKLIKWLLILLGFVSILYVNSNFMDPDLGWHLRFGKEFSEGRFSYVDTYTWGHDGQPWINHEWGGDIFLWQVYGRYGYLPLLLLMSFLPWAAFLIMIRVFQKKITITSLVTTLFVAWSVHHVFSVRLAPFSALFLALLLWSLERLPDKKTYYFWPILFWIWAALHGSWVLGFIVIGVYAIGNLLELSSRGAERRSNPSAIRLALPLNGIASSLLKVAPRNDNVWTPKTIYQAGLWSMISLVITLINPYGIDLWKEVLSYFTESYYKTHITEWVSSYTYPVYWQTILLAGIGIAFFILALRHKRLTVPQALLFILFFVSAAKYKRQALYFAMVALPLISLTIQSAGEKILATHRTSAMVSSKIVKLTMWGFSIPLIALLIFYHLSGVRWIKDVWKDEVILLQYPMPVEAIKFLKQKIGASNTFLFNEFAWGGYLNWVLPQAKIFLGGQGTATWRFSKKETMLERYHKIISEPQGLRQIESGPSRYIILAKSVNLPPPDYVNRLLFNEDELNKFFSNSQTQLEQSLSTSPAWKLIFEDDVARVWERK